MTKNTLPRTLRRCGAFAAALAMAFAETLGAQEAPAYEQPDNVLLRSVAVVLVLAGTWFILYKLVYPFFLRYYRPSFCKNIFWTHFILYSLTWLLLASYVVFDFGFYFFWMKWVAAFLCVLWLISTVVLMLRRVPA